jgi:hypothetical protein
MKRLKKLIDKVAYISVGTDFLIAISTYLVINRVSFSDSALLLSDYIDFVVVAIVATMFLTLTLMKYQERLVRQLKTMAFRMRNK